MATYKKPNMSQLNSAINKAKTANNNFQQQANKTIRDLKNLERQVKTYQNKLHSTSTTPLRAVPSLYLGAVETDELDYSQYTDIRCPTLSRQKI